MIFTFQETDREKQQTVARHGIDPDGYILSLYNTARAGRCDEVTSACHNCPTDSTCDKTICIHMNRLTSPRAIAIFTLYNVLAGDCVQMDRWNWLRVFPGEKNMPCGLTIGELISPLT